MLPESFDPRIQKAIIKLKELGFNIPTLDDFNKNYDIYFDYLSNRKFSANWPESELIKYLDNPINKALTILACNHVDGVVAGAATSTSHVLRSSLRIVGIDKNSKWVSSVILLISPSLSKFS